MAIKRKEGENLSDANIDKVIALLEAEKPVTKKEACDILNISYNTTRLAKIIEEYREKIARVKNFRAANRGKPATEQEICTIIEDFLGGEPLKNIADNLYRGTDFVKRIIEEVGVPQAKSGGTYFNFDLLPDECVEESFEVGEYVWSSRYGCIVEIMKDLKQSCDGSPVYQIYVHQRIDSEKMLIDGKRFAFHVEKGGGFYASQAAFDLGSLRHLRKLGVDIKRSIK